MCSSDLTQFVQGQYGKDGAGASTYALNVTNGADSGLIDVATGNPIVLFNNGGVIEGRVGNTSGPVDFTVSVNANTGVVTLTQLHAVKHPDTTNPDDIVSLGNAVNGINLTETITDRDGDKANASIDISDALNFRDDGPSVKATPDTSAPELLVDESNLAEIGRAHV